MTSAMIGLLAIATIGFGLVAALPKPKPVRVTARGSRR